MSDQIMSLAQARGEARKAVPARERLTALFDPDTFVEVGTLVKNGCDGAGVITGYGLVDGSPVYAFSQDITVKSGAVGEAHGSKIKKIYELSLKTGAPLVGIYDSNGAALAEGLDAMNAYGDLLCWTNNLSGVVPQISLVLGVCAGSAAMIAASADFVVMSERENFLSMLAMLKKVLLRKRQKAALPILWKKMTKLPLQQPGACCPCCRSITCLWRQCRNTALFPAGKILWRLPQPISKVRICLKLPKAQWMLTVLLNCRANLLRMPKSLLLPSMA